jgi:hypothetical protein
MPNKILIQPLFAATETNKTGQITTSISEKKNEIMIFPLTEDISFVTQSELASWSDMVPGLEILTTIQSVMVELGGTVSGGILNLQNMIDSPRWQKTLPLEFTVSLGFYLIDNALENIYKPMKRLIGLSILSRNEKGGIVPPGIFMPAAAAVNKKPNQTVAEKLSNSAKLIAVKIPGIITMPLAIIKSCTPVFSKHITETGFPLWGTLELNITGLYPAFAEDFNAWQSDEEKQMQEDRERGFRDFLGEGFYDEDVQL